MKIVLTGITLLVLTSCVQFTEQNEASYQEQITTHSSFLQLIDFLQEVDHLTASTLNSNWEYLSELVEELDHLFVKGRNNNELELFKQLITEQLNTEYLRLAPIRGFSTTHLVNAPVEEVWQTLVEVDQFPEWNEFTPRVETTFDVGSPIIMYVRLFPFLPDFIFRQPETVVIFSTLDEMCWESVFGSDFWMLSHRCYQVEAISESETNLSSSMEYTGVLAPLVNNLTKPLVTIGFNDVAEGLKERVE